MRTDAINWFASSELCRSLQDGGKTPLTLMRLEETLNAMLDAEADRLCGALCRQSSTTLDIVHAEDGPPITQRTSGLGVPSYPREPILRVTLIQGN